MRWEPAGPESPSRHSADHPGAERQDTEDKEVRIGWPSEDGEGRHGQEDHQQTPVVDRAGRRMPTTIPVISGAVGHSARTAGLMRAVTTGTSATNTDARTEPSSAIARA